MEQPLPPGFKPPLHSPQPQPRENVIVSNIAFGNNSQHLNCPHCHANISTKVKNAANTKTHLIAILFCLSGLWCCIPCPYFIDSCMMQEHYCPACNAYLGSHN